MPDRTVSRPALGPLGIELGRVSGYEGGSWDLSSADKGATRRWQDAFPKNSGPRLAVADVKERPLHPLSRVHLNSPTVSIASFRAASRMSSSESSRSFS